MKNRLFITISLLFGLGAGLSNNSLNGSSWFDGLSNISSTDDEYKSTKKEMEEYKSYLDEDEKFDLTEKNEPVLKAQSNKVKKTLKINTLVKKVQKNSNEENSWCATM